MDDHEYDVDGYDDDVDVDVEDEKQEKQAKQVEQEKQKEPEEPEEEGKQEKVATRELPAALRERLAARGIISERQVDHAATREEQSAAAPSTTASDQLPPGWASAVDPTYKTNYYFNSSSGERRWDKPSALPPTSSPPILTPSAAVVEALPFGWTSATDPTYHRIYYFNPSTGERQWDKPTQSTAQTFYPSHTFAGPSPGYIFKLGATGLGYYIDHPPQRHQSSAAMSHQSAPVIHRAPQIVKPDQLNPVPLVGLSEEESKMSKVERMRAEQLARNTALAAQKGQKRSRQVGGGQDFDPMDPSSYSDAPRGGWSRGLERPGLPPPAAGSG